jgi:hypothetical protein
MAHQYQHPHKNPAHVMIRYRRHIMSCKKKWSSARGLIHYKEFIREYLAAKHLYLSVKRSLKHVSQ